VGGGGRGGIHVITKHREGDGMYMAGSSHAPDRGGLLGKIIQFHWGVAFGDRKIADFQNKHRQGEKKRWKVNENQTEGDAVRSRATVKEDTKTSGGKSKENEG